MAVYPAVLTVVITAACVLVPLAAANAGPSRYQNNNIFVGALGVCAGIAASPALFAGEDALGVGQAVSGNKMSLMYLPGGSIFNPDDTKYNNSSLTNNSVGNNVQSPNFKVPSVAISAPSKSAAKTTTPAVSIITPKFEATRNPNNTKSSVTPKAVIPKESVNTTQIDISKEKEEVKNLGKQIR